MTAYCLSIFPAFILKMMNILLADLLRAFFTQKRRYKQAILSCLDEHLRERYAEETYADLPVIPLNDPNNLMQSITLINLLMDLHSTNMRRGQIFLATTFVV